MSATEIVDAVALPDETAASTGGRPGAMRAWLRLFASELRLITGRRRNQAGLAVLLSVPIIIGIAVWNNAPRGPHGPAFMSSITDNGIFVALTALTAEITLFLPLAVAALTGDTVAGEAGGGTLRYVLTVPVGRAKLLLTKYAAVVTGLAIGTFAVAITGILVGLALFSNGPVLTLSGVELPYAEAVWRVLLAAAYVTAGLAALAALGMFISTLTEQPIAAMITVVIVVTAMWITTGIAQMDFLHPYLLVTQWSAFGDLFREPIFTDNIARGMLVNGAYTVVGLAAALWRFTRADITS
ncbi:MAG: ABC transporter permease [Dermatophilus congolensis]|nr:ABC transporter permease [Dermatophilus congolensis]